MKTVNSGKVSVIGNGDDKAIVIDNDKVKMVRSKSYNSNFDKVTGYFMRWGVDRNDDPSYSKFGMELIDWELSTECSMACKHCYKSNSAVGHTIDMKTFKQAADKLFAVKTLTQAAYGVGSLDRIPHLKDIFEYTRAAGIIPNITINGEATDEQIKMLAMYVGAVSVSHYSDDSCYNAIERLHKASELPGATLKQINIHELVHKGGYEKCLKVIDDAKNDSRLVGKLNAIVYLSLKPKGKRNKLESMPMEMFFNVISKADEAGVKYGMDSCSSPQILKWAEENNRPELTQCVEPCESQIFSLYCNSKCEIFACSFCEDEDGHNGISVLECKDFIKDIWYHKDTIQWRDNLINSSSNCVSCSVKKFCRNCPAFNITPCKK